MNEGWTISIETAGTESAELDAFTAGVEDLLEVLHDHGAAISSSTDATRYGATFTCPDVDPGSIDPAAGAATTGIDTFRRAAEKAGLPAWPIVRLEVLTWAEFDAELARPVIPELVGVGEVAEILGVTRQRASKLASQHPDFPVPVAELKSGPVWTRPSLNVFVNAWDRRPGRPKTPDTLDLREWPSDHAMELARAMDETVANPDALERDRTAARNVRQRALWPEAPEEKPEPEYDAVWKVPADVGYVKPGTIIEVEETGVELRVEKVSVSQDGDEPAEVTAYLRKVK